jgi:hypothetical protein
MRFQPVYVEIIKVRRSVVAGFKALPQRELFDFRIVRMKIVPSISHPRTRLRQGSGASKGHSVTLQIPANGVGENTHEIPRTLSS